MRRFPCLTSCGASDAPGVWLMLRTFEAFVDLQQVSTAQRVSSMCDLHCRGLIFPPLYASIFQRITWATKNEIEMGRYAMCKAFPVHFGLLTGWN